MKKQQNIWKELSQKLNKKQLLFILLIGILLMVIALPTDVPEKEHENNTDMETRLEKVLREVKGAGEVKVMITYREDNSIEGMVIVSDGGDNAVVVQNMTEIVQALFDVKTHKIKVIRGYYKK